MTNVPEVSLLAVYPKELKTRIQTKPHTAMFTAARFMVATGWRCPSVCQWVGGHADTCSIHATEFCSGTKTPSTDAGMTWANPKGGTPSERSTARNVTLYSSIHMTFKNRQNWAKVTASALVAAGATGGRTLTVERTAEGPRGWCKWSMPWPRGWVQGGMHLSKLIKLYTWNGVLLLSINYTPLKFMFKGKKYRKKI